MADMSFSEDILVCLHVLPGIIKGMAGEVGSYDDTAGFNQKCLPFTLILSRDYSL